MKVYPVATEGYRSGVERSARVGRNVKTNTRPVKRCSLPIPQ